MEIYKQLGRTLYGGSGGYYPIYIVETSYNQLIKVGVCDGIPFTEDGDLRILDNNISSELKEDIKKYVSEYRETYGD